jgi:hypothetical protein
MTAPTSGALTTAGYTQVGTTGVWNKTFGTAVVTFSIAQGASGSSLTVTPTGDVSAADFDSVVNSLASLGIPGFFRGIGGNDGAGIVTGNPIPAPTIPVNLLAQSGLQSFGMSL